jgi:signal transduction histidine kinase
VKQAANVRGIHDRIADTSSASSIFFRELRKNRGVLRGPPRHSSAFLVPESCMPSSQKSARPWGSMERRLPLLVSMLLVVVIGTLSLLAYRALRTELLTAADEHSAQVGEHLADILMRSAERARGRADSLATRPELAAVVQGDPGARERASAVLSSFASRQSSIIGAGVTTGGADWAAWAEGPSADSIRAEARLPGILQRPMAPTIGPIRSAGGPGLFYDVSTPLPPTGSRLGPEDRVNEAWLVIRYRIASGEQARTLASLVGTDAVFLVGSSGSAVEWTDLQHAVAAPEPRGDGSYRWRDETYRGSVLELSEAPWRVWTGIPHGRVLAPARAFAGVEAVLGLFALLLGAVIAWLLGRHVSRPIARLTRAADGLSRGGYHERVPEDGPHEVEQLAGAFNRMAQRVEVAAENLEEQVEVRTRQLSAALEELRTTQEQLLRRERLAFLGQLAGGVGHELRNPLGVMTNAVFYLDAVSPDASAEVREYHGILRTQLVLADKIVTDLLDFARSPKPAHAPVKLDALVEDQLRRLDEHSFDIARQYEDGLPPALADETQIGQVVFNLLTNAVQAMDGAAGEASERVAAGATAGAASRSEEQRRDTPESITVASCGRLTLRTFRTDRGDVALSVSDTGPGIPEEEQEKIFEPLYTTRARGIGLGLAVSKNLVEANQGHIRIRSRPGAGTTFVIHLPSAEEA